MSNPFARVIPRTRRSIRRVIRTTVPRSSLRHRCASRTLDQLSPSGARGCAQLRRNVRTHPLASGSPSTHTLQRSTDTLNAARSLIPFSPYASCAPTTRHHAREPANRGRRLVPPFVAKRRYWPRRNAPDAGSVPGAFVAGEIFSRLPLRIPGDAGIGLRGVLNDKARASHFHFISI